jgi:TRAP-type uncharacterized transport system substrate-binding protein
MRMPKIVANNAVVLFVLLITALGVLDQAHAQQLRYNYNPYEEKRREANDIAVSIITSGITCTCARFAEDIRNVVNDLRPNGLRVLPVLGVGGLQTLNDVLFLKSIDMGVVDEDNLRLLKQRNPTLYADVDQRVQYIAKLYNSEFHVLARNEIKSYEDLRGKKVNFNLKDSQTDVTADVVFTDLGIDVERSYYDNDEAIRRLRDGELAAMIVLTGAPQAALVKLTAEDGVHFLPLDEQSLPARDTSKVLKEYMPSELTHEEYPALIPDGAPVHTIGNRALLVTYAWAESSPRYNRVAKFVREFFGKIDQFQSAARHPKWREFNAEVEIPGWTRFKPAGDLIAAQKIARVQSSVVPPPQDVSTLFERYTQYAAATGQKPLSDAERTALFTKFQQFLATQQQQ